MKRLRRLRKSGVIVRPSDSAPERRSASPPGEALSVRRANPADIAFVGRLSGSVFSVYGPYRELVQEWFEAPSTVTLIAVEDGKPTGFAMVGRLLDESQREHRCELLAIAVEAGSRRRGTGRLLLREVELEAERMNEHTLFLHTATANVPAQSLFMQMGFTVLAVRTIFYPSGQDALKMSKVL